MASPAKRRKKNNQGSPEKPVRGIDFFFSKKVPNQQDDASKPQQTTGIQPNGPETIDTTDEELARKLQQEWNQEEDVKVSRADQRLPASKPDDTSSEPVELRESRALPQPRTLALQST